MKKHTRVNTETLNKKFPHYTWHFIHLFVALFLSVCLIFLAFPVTSIAYAKTAAADSWSQGAKSSQTICDGGITLLKNDKDLTGKSVLPLDSQHLKLNIFGVGGCDNGWYYQGNGSGAGCQSNQISLYKAFRQNGFEINESLASDYNNSGMSNRVPVTEDPKINYQIHEVNPQFVTDHLQSAYDFSDQALVVFSRYGGEGNDLPKFQYKNIGGVESYDGSKIYSELSTEEEQMLAFICSKFSNVYILFNCCSPMQMGFLNNYPSIKAAMYMPMGGNYGASCVPHAMSGAINPSGHMTDTVAYDFKTAPSYANMSYELYQTDPTASFDHRYDKKRFSDYQSDYTHFTCYEENIYEGYYWYESADVEGYWTSQGTDYNHVVQFPFGYGKSYTNFDWQLQSVSAAQGSTLGKDTALTFKVKVTNTGKTAGKDVVQLYVEKPYLKGGIEKPAKQLCGFAKTQEIPAGSYDVVTVSVNLQDIADYDCYDKNNNSHMGYELDAGSYNFCFQTDSHQIKNANLICNYNISSTIIYDTDKDTGTPISNLFTTYTNTESGASSRNTDKHSPDSVCRSIDGADFNEGQGIGANYLSRANFSATFPSTELAQMNIGTDYEKTKRVNKPWDDYDGDLPPQGQAVTKTLDDVKGLSYEDPVWDEVLNSLTYEEMSNLVTQGGFKTNAISKINKKEAVDKDGPCGFASGVNGSKITPTNFPSDTMVGHTWNFRMSELFGLALGYEGINKLGGINGCYGPGLNLHRSPLGGRNFEYYSEDPYLSGVICSWQISGCKDSGMYCYVKHIALNDSDAGRNGRYNFATEQTLRQIYAKPFEIISKGALMYDQQGNPVQAGKANAAMGSVDRIGTTRLTGSYNFLNQMLRSEWGFRGSVITDYYQAGDVNDIDEGIRSGNDLALNGANNCQFDDTTSNTYYYWLRIAAKNILFTYVDTIK